jgi:Ca2+-binding RTX toxin-like protein
MARWLIALSLGVIACRGTVPPSDGPAPSSTAHRPGAPGASSGAGGAPSRAASTDPVEGGSNGGAGGGKPNANHPPVVLPAAAPSSTLAPSGCSGGVVRGALSLDLDAMVPSLELRAAAGQLLANGLACSDAAGNELALADLVSLSVQGGDEDDAVRLDLSSGDWSRLLGSPESVNIALGAGNNALLVRGTAQADHYAHAMRGDQIALDLVGDGRVHALAAGVGELGFDLGAGDDRLEDLASLAGAAASGDAAAGIVGPADAGASASAPVPLSALTVPLVVFGGDGNDWLVGGSGNDAFDPGDGDDVVSGRDGDDVIFAGTENDGNDIFNGGGGYDEVSYERRTADLDLVLCNSDASLGCTEAECACTTPSGAAGENDRLVNVEELRGGSGNDVLRGTSASESLRGGPGNDSLYGGGGSDLLDGQEGDDVLDGGADGDICDGSAGEAVSACEL